MPSYFQAKVRLAHHDTFVSLIDSGVIKSAESLAVLSPQLTGVIEARVYSDPMLQKLYYSIYKSFRKRRSLLLLNLESQVRIEELPWVSVLKPFRSSCVKGPEVAKEALTDLAIMNFEFFPHTLVPNKLLQEFRALGRSAAIDMPILEELAADIFMGRFSGKFLYAAHRAANLLSNSLYAKYYCIDYESVLNINDVCSSGFQKVASDGFTRFCVERIDKKLKPSYVAKNGMIIEQQQIVTTQNLATLFSLLDLQLVLGNRLKKMITDCFRYVCSTLQINAKDVHSKLLSRKKSAYAWRQMIFYLALLTERDQRSLVCWCEEYLKSQPESFVFEFEAIFIGLARIVNTDQRSLPQDVAPFLGWTASAPKD